MVKRAYSPREIRKMVHVPIPWDGEWKKAFGCPDINDTWFISGESASGKSSFCMQLAKKLCEFGSVLYVSLEEGVSMSFQQRICRFHMEEVQRKFRVVTNGDIKILKERLHRKKSAKFIFIDSFQIAQVNYNWDYKQAVELVEEFPRKCFIFVSQEKKSTPMGSAAVRLDYIAGVKIRVKGYKAICKGRFVPEAGAFFKVWEDGIIQTSNNL